MSKKTPLTWAHKVSAAFLLAMTALYVWLVYSSATLDYPTYSTPVIRAPVVETVLFPVVVTSTPTHTPTLTSWSKTATALPTKTVRPYQTKVPTRTPTPIWISDPANGRMSER